MKNRKWYLAISLIVFLSGIFAIAGYVYAAQSITEQDRQALVESANQIKDSNISALNILKQHGVKDADLEEAAKQTHEGSDLVSKGAAMMTGSTMDKGKDMVERGTNMLLAGHKTITAVAEKHGMTEQCEEALGACSLAEQRLKPLFQTYGLHGDWTSR